MLGSNSIQFRFVKRKVEESSGTTWKQEIQFRTKDITSSIVGIVPVSNNWSDWVSISEDSIVYVDENGQDEIIP